MMLKIEPNSCKLKHLYLSSGDGDEYPGCSIGIAIARWYITINLPQVIKPYREKVMAESWNAATVARLGRNWYWSYDERRYGVSLYENNLSFQLGRQTMDSSTTQRWSCFLPWGEWRHVRFSLYDLNGKHFWTQLEHKRKRGPTIFDAQREAELRVPKAVFRFKDFDGEEIEAKTHIQEREWLRGEKWCKWLSWFYRPMIRRSLDIEFSKETGPRKGSWKGGTLGHGIGMLPGELHEPAFKRYCVEHKMIFLGLPVTS